MRFHFGSIVMLCAVLAGGPAQAAQGGLTVFAAASLTDAFKDIGNLWMAAGHKPITFSFDSSSTLALQIQHGAPADVFASADELWMDRLAKDDRIEPATRVDFAANTLVLVEPRAALKKVALKPGVDFRPILGASGRLAVGDPGHVPAGIYAAQALRKLGVWNAVKSRLAPAANVRGALMLVSSGEAPAGIVYATDVKLIPAVAVAGIFPEDSHDPIKYPVAVTRRGNGKEAEGFVAFLKSQPAQDVLRHYGFLLP
jgi:molybdate transport system substrate-binding protein